MGNIRGIAFMLLSMAGFAISDGFVKALTNTISAGQLLVVFGVTGGAILAVMSKARGATLSGPWLTSPIFLTRLATDMLAAAAVVSSFALVPLSLVSAILQVSPLVAAAFAVWLLGESLGPRRLLAILAGLVGVLIMIEPWGERLELGALLAFFGASMFALRDVLTRKMPADVPSDAMVTYGFFAMAPAGVIVLTIEPSIAPMDVTAVLLTLGGVLSGIFGYTMITLASRIAEISAIAPFRYARLLFAL
ncbi:MAG: DMT family transporter, partial [Pseudomonadota bacterium]